MANSRDSKFNGIIRVLHVDDDLPILEVSKQILMMENNFKIDSTTSVDEAYKMLETDDYDVIISDYEMPIKNGLDFLKELREQENKIPFILFTGRGREEVAVTALNLGANGYHNKQGSPESVFGELAHLVKAVVAHNKAETALIESQTLTHSIIDSTDDLIWSVNNVDFGLMDYNKSLKSYFQNEMGISIEVGMRPENLFSTAQLVDQWKEFYVRALKENSFSTEYNSFNGKYIIQLNFSVIRKEDRIFGISVFGKNITKQKQLDESLRVNQNRLKKAQALAHVGNWEFDLQTKKMWGSEEAFRIYGIKPLSEFLPTDLIQRITLPEYRSKIDSAFKELVNNDREFNIEFKIRLADSGEERFVHSKAELVRDQNNVPIKINGVIQDITESKEAESQLKLLAENMHDVVWIMTIDGQFTYISPSVMQLRGYTAEEVKQQSLEEVLMPKSLQIAKKFLQNLIKTGELQTKYLELEQICKNGSTVWTEINFGIIRDKDGKPQQIIGVSRDITERKNVEEELKSSEKKYRTLFEQAGDYILILEVPTGEIPIIYDANDFALDLHGYSREELIGKPITFLDVTSQKSEILGRVKRLLKDEKIIFEAIHRRKDNSQFTVEIVNKHVKVGNKDFLLSIERDITERKKVEEELRIYSNFLTLATDSILVVDLNGNLVYFNEAVYEKLGYSKEEISKMTIYDLDSPESTQLLESRIKELIEKGSAVFEVEQMRKDRSRIPMEVHARVIESNGKKLILGVLRDITERKKAQKEFFESEQRYRMIATNIQDVITLANIQGIFTYVSPSMETSYGYKPEELIGKSYFDFIHPDDKGVVAESVEPILKTGGENTGVEFRFKGKNGSYFWLEGNAKVISEKGETRILAVTRNIDKRKKIENKLKDSDRIFENSIDMIGIAGFDGYFKVLNPSWSRTLGWSKEELLSKPWIEFVHPEDKESTIKQRTNLVNGQEVYQFQNRYICKDGGIKWLAWNSFPYPKEKIIFAVARDITERKETEDKLAAANEKLRVIGKLSRHDVRNKLSIINANTYLLKRKLGNNPEVVKYLTDINSAITMSDRIFEFSQIYEKMGLEEQRDIDVKSCFNEAIKLLPNLSTIKITNKAKGLTVIADSLLGQLFYNLLENSLKHGKKVNEIKLYYKEKEKQMKLYYEDNGVGVSIENKAHIFNEGFTTGDGTGLGLSMIRKVMEVYGWKINEAGTPGKGAKFEITIPKNKCKIKRELITDEVIS